MTTVTKESLYELLPAIYRIKDAGQEQSLRALFAILENEVQAMEDDIQGLYDNWFIETCDEWVVPYIADLLGVAQLQTGGIAGFSLRSYVANVLAYRRGKGTASVLEQMAKDVSGWPTRAVEFQKSLATTQHLNHIRSQIPATADLRNANQLELVGGPFQKAKYSVEVRRIEGGRGKYNIPNIGLFVWRLQSYFINRVAAARIDNKRFTINPLQVDMPLFNLPETETRISQLAEEHNVPGPLRRRPLYDELEARRRDLILGNTPEEKYFDEDPVLSIYLDNSTQALYPEEIAICDLSDWDEKLSPVAQGIKAQVDPHLGRIAFTGLINPSSVEVSHAYGFSADIGGGPYNRSESLEGLFDKQNEIWWAEVSNKDSNKDSNSETSFESLEKAVEAWNGLSNYDVGVIAILDNFSYEEKLTGKTKLVIKEGKKLLIVAASWLSGEIPKTNDWSPTLGLNYFLTPSRLRPHIKGNISVSGEGEENPGELHLNGLLIEGELSVLSGELGKLDLAHCTLVPGKSALHVSATKTRVSNSRLAINISHSICGPITIPETSKSLTITDSIIDAIEEDDNGETNRDAKAIAGVDSVSKFTPPVTIQRSTIFGTVHCKELSLASEVIFDNVVEVKRLQAGCVRFSYVTPGSKVPRRFRCQPDLALEERLKQLPDDQKNPDLSLPEKEKTRIELWMEPEFSSTRYGAPDYAQLSMGCPVCPDGIRTGAEDGSEIGVFSHLKQPQRETNIRTSFNEYLRFGMKAEIFYVNYKEISTGLGNK